MAYVQPYTDICLLRDVPLDNHYDNTLTFTSQAAQFAYFYSKRVKYITANSYQRTMKGTLRIACSMDEAIECNYLYFNNRLHEDKIIYAFITGWEYVNEETTEISYEIDVFQTFWYDVRLLDVFVEREHSNTDTVGENLVEENLEIGDYIVNGSTQIVPTVIENVVATNASVIFFTTFNDDATCSDFTGGYTSYVYTGLNVIKKDTINDIQTFINNAISNNKKDGIIAAYMCPYSPNTYDQIVWSKPIVKNITTLDGYTPKNNKLYTGPYNVLRIRTDTDAQQYRYEYFAGTYCDFYLMGTIVPEPTLTLVPVGYGAISATRLRTDMRMTIKNFPQVAIDCDIFKVYLAQNSASLPVSMITNGVRTGAKLINSAFRLDVGGMINEAVNWGADIANSLAQMHDIETKPPQLNGTQSSLADYAVGAKIFVADSLTIRAEYARIIDDYFDMFGYATKRVKQPNITGRPHWNYVKTIGTTVDALGVPAPYLDKMNQCFNKGITFWHNPNEVGSYTTLDNRPV